MDKYKKDFLKSLQHQLLEQTENDDPNPHFWMIGYHRIEWDCPEEYASGWGVFDGEEQIGELNDTESVLKVLMDPEGYNLQEKDLVGCNRMDILSVLDTTNRLLEKRAKMFEARYFSYLKLTPLCLQLHWYKQTSELYTGAVFLTKQACLDYISRHNDTMQYGIRLFSPYPCKMTAKNCPEYEQLCNILKTTNWD